MAEVIAMTRCGEVVGSRIVVALDVAAATCPMATSNFFDRGQMPFVLTVARRAAVEVRRCYCVVNESEFAVPLREQLQTRCVHPGLGGRSHLLSQSRGFELGGKQICRS